MRKPLLAAAIPALAVLAAGCGSSHATKPASKKVAVARTRTTKAKTTKTTSKTVTTKAKTHPKAKTTATKTKTTRTTVEKKPTAKALAVDVSSRTLPHLGAVLVDSAGHTLYVFAPDNARRVTCSASCQAVWPPLKLPLGARPVAVGPVHANLLGSDPNPVGGRVVTYDGWPLYTFTGDSAAGVATGEGLDLNGGRWYVIAPSGKLVRAATSASSASSRKSKAKARSGGSGY